MFKFITYFNMNRSWFLPLLMISVAIFFSLLLTVANEGPNQEKAPANLMLVNTQLVNKQDHTIIVKSHGRVSPTTQSSIFSEISGSVIEVSPYFVKGGYVKEGHILVRLDDRNYLAALKKAEADLSSARKELVKAKGRAQVAYLQWKKRKPGNQTAEARSLALYEPQLRESEAKVFFAIAELERVKGDLEKTQIKAPYDGIVKEKFIDLGHFLSPSNHMFDIFSIDKAEIKLAIPQHRLTFLDLPRLAVSNLELDAENSEQLVEGDDLPIITGTNMANKKLNIPVVLRQSYGGEYFEWQAMVVRSGGVIDESSNTLSVVAQIDDPYNVVAIKNGHHVNNNPLLMGAFVNAEIQGSTLEGVVSIPRNILRSGSRVWIVDKNNKLRNRVVNLINVGGDKVYVSAGLDNGDRLCLTRVGEVVPGTQVRVSKDKGLEMAFRHE